VVLVLRSACCERDTNTVLGHKSEQKLYGTLPETVPNLYPVTMVRVLTVELMKSDE